MLSHAARRTLAPRAWSRAASTVSASTVESSVSSNSVKLPAINTIEASWKTLSTPEREAVFNHLVDIQKQDWKSLSLDEKRACYYVAYGPHGPREPLHGPGHGKAVFFGTVAAVGLGIGMFAFVRSLAPPPPKTMTKEWQEKTNEYAKEHNMNPLSGISSEGYKGKGFVQ